MLSSFFFRCLLLSLWFCPVPTNSNQKNDDFFRTCFISFFSLLPFIYCFHTFSRGDKKSNERDELKTQTHNTQFPSIIWLNERCNVLRKWLNLVRVCKRWCYRIIRFVFDSVFFRAFLSICFFRFFLLIMLICRCRNSHLWPPRKKAFVFLIFRAKGLLAWCKIKQHNYIIFRLKRMFAENIWLMKSVFVCFVFVFLFARSDLHIFTHIGMRRFDRTAIHLFGSLLIMNGW